MPESFFEASILTDLTIVREERSNLSIPNLRAVLAAGEGTRLIKADGNVKPAHGHYFPKVEAR